MFLLLGFLFFHLRVYSQTPVNYTVDGSTTGYTLKKAFGLPSGKTGVISLREDNHFFCTVVNSDGSVAHSFDITSQLSLQTTTNYIEINAIGTPSGNIFITYTSPGTDNITNANARYLVLNQSSGATIATGNVNSTLPAGTILNRYLDLAVLSNGNVVVTWEIHQENADHSTTASSESGVLRILTEAGASVTSDIVFGGPGSAISTPILNCFGAKVAANSGGGFLVFFYNYLGNFRAIRFNNSGTAQSTGGVNAFLVDPAPWTGNFHLYKAVGLANGSYMLFYARSQIGYYKVISAEGVDVKAITSITDFDLAREVKTNGRVETMPVNTAGKQGFAIAIGIYENYTDLNDPNTKVRTYNYDLSGNFLSSPDLTSYFIADLQPLFLLYSGLPSGIGVAYRTYKTYGTSANGATFSADADLKGVNLDFDLPTMTSITRKTPTAATTNATSVTYQVVFSTAVTGVDASDFSLNATGGVTGTIGTVSGSGTTYAVTVNSIAGNGTLRLDLNSSGTGIVSGGNTAIADGFSTGDLYTFDHIVPTLTPVTIASNNANPLYAKVGDKITVSFTASEIIQTPTVLIAGQPATVSNVTGNQWKGEYTMTNLQTAGVVTFSIVFSDLPGNSGTTVNAVTTGGGSVTFDKTAPTISSISRFDPANAITEASTVIFKVTYSETVNNIDINDFAIAQTGTASGTIVSVSATSGSIAEVTVNNVSGIGTLGLNGKNTGVIDNAGNSIATGFTGETYTYLGPPIVTNINRQDPTNETTNATSVIYRVTFSKPVTGVDKDDFTLTTTGTVSGNIASVGNFGANGDTYDVTINTIGGDGTMRLDLKSSGTGIVDDGSTAITGDFTTGEVYTFDHSVPTLTSAAIISNNTINTDYAKVGDIISLSFTTSEAVGIPTVTIATHSVTPMAGTGFNYTAKYTITNTDVEGAVPITINFSDGAGNSGTQITATTNTSTVTFDHTQPSVTVNQTGTVDPTSSNTIHFTVAFSEPVTDFTATDVSLSGTANAATNVVTEVAPNNGTTYDIAVSGMANDGTVIASIAANKVIDVAGNGNTASTTNDNTVTYVADAAPSITSITRKTPATALTNIASVTYLITFSEAVSGVDAGDFTLTKTGTADGTIATVPTGTATTYDVTVNSLEGDGTLRLDVKSSGTGIQDNINQDISGGFTTGETYTIDHTVPTVTSVGILSNNVNTALAKVGNTITLSFVASETIGAPMVTIAGHTVRASNSNANNWSAAYTLVNADAEGLVTFTIDFTDLASNAGTQVTATTNSSNVTFDKTAPAVKSINRFNSAPQGTISTTLKFTTTFGENVTGVDASDFVLTNVSGNPGITAITDVSVVSGSVYDVTATVSAINGAEVRLDLKAIGTGIKDAADNDITTGFMLGQTYILGQPPTITQVQGNITASPNQAGCTSLQSFMVKASGSPTPTITYKIGNTVITSPYAFPSGITTTVNATAGNGIGSPATTSFTVTVSTSLSLSIPSASAYTKGVSQNTIYIGWTPASRITYTASANGGRSAYAYKWTTSSNSLSIAGSSTASSVQVTSNKAGSYTLMLEVTDGYGCKKTNSITVFVKDIRCGNKNDKVTVCKTTKPAGAVCIEASSVVNQLNSGAFLGTCPPSMFTTNIMQREKNEIIAKKLSLKALPNPTKDQFTLHLSGGSENGISLRVVDVLGRTVEVRNGVAAQSTLQIGAGYRPGIYILEAVQGSERVTLKLIKQRD